MEARGSEERGMRNDEGLYEEEDEESVGVKENLRALRNPYSVKCLL